MGGELVLGLGFCLSGKGLQACENRLYCSTPRQPLPIKHAADKELGSSELPSVRRQLAGNEVLVREAGALSVIEMGESVRREGEQPNVNTSECDRFRRPGGHRAQNEVSGSEFPRLVRVVCPPNGRV